MFSNILRASTALASSVALTLVAAGAPVPNTYPSARHYCGTLWSGGTVAKVTTDFTISADGSVQGTYRFRQDYAKNGNHEQVSGTLAGQRSPGLPGIDFVWQDKFGTGRLHIQLSDDLGSFVGKWGAKTDPLRHQWNGRGCSDQQA